MGDSLIDAIFDEFPVPHAPLYCLWIRSGATFVWLNKNPGGNSSRRTKKARKVFILLGIDKRAMVILPKGVTPP